MMIPGQPVPPLVVKLVDGGTFDLASEQPEHFSLVVFYRGLHCPMCGATVEDLEQRHAELAAMGVQSVAISGDSEERAAKSTAQWGIQNLRIGYDLDGSTAESWGLFRSSAALPEEPEIFFEPALFLVRPDGSLYGSSVNSMPFARSSLNDLQQALTMIIKNQFPARGVATRP